MNIYAATKHSNPGLRLTAPVEVVGIYWQRRSGLKRSEHDMRDGSRVVEMLKALNPTLPVIEHEVFCDDYSDYFGLK
ncbi:hypothetical protein F3J28_03435 [Enterobacter sp. Ap-1006]|uniref:hypothetical protein n=1 Tax=Enterobacter sp. Ap-1006 TaxID=2608345 RepID=UPI001420C091|nr:hypothetical protein [Enterobacter sp. Ap-1006]NIF46821.1 hypothetical protein [Enterobacter sp. Ap-1006]